jgi:hypothetical protein
MSKFLSLGAKVFSLLLLAGFLSVREPNRATAEVTNRLTVVNNTSEGINFFINGKQYLTNVAPGPARSRDCYPSSYGEKGNLQLKAVGVNSGRVYLNFSQTGRVNNLTVPVNP